MDYIKEKFRLIEDKRHTGYIEHELANILIIIMCSVLCGLDGLAEICTFSKKREKFFKEKFGIENIPSKPTFSRVLNLLDSEAVAEVIIEIMKEKTKFIKNMNNILAVDGKAIRSTSKKGHSHSALQILTAYLTGNGVVLGQKSIHEKTNEIPIFQEMLETLDIQGKTVTADAMHCQKETCKRIIAKEGNYVFGLKENQKLLHDDVHLFISDRINQSDIEIYTTTEKNGGRIEKRICKKVTNISWLPMREEWAGLKVVFAIRRVTTTKYGQTDETNYYISSLDISAEELLKIVREHWKIESMHWLLDVVFSEDECTILSENGHKTLNILRKLALMIHKQYIASISKKCSIKSSLLNCLLDEDSLWGLLESL